MSARLEELEALLETNRGGGGPKYVERHRERGKLLVRERIELLLDRDSPFLELQPFIAHGTDYHVGGSIVTGIGVVEGVECVVNGNDSTIRGGTNNPYTLRKALRAQEIAERNRLPLINLVESGGADLPTQADQFVPGGAMFRNLTRLSSLGIPTLALVFGSSTAGGAYVPGLCDHTVFVRDRARVFLGGPAAGEDGDRGGGRRGGARRRGDALAHVRPVGLPRRRRARCAAPRARHRAPAQLAQARPRPDRGGRRAALRRRGAARRDVRRSARSRSTRPTCSRGSSTARASTSSSRSTAPR